MEWERRWNGEREREREREMNELGPVPNGLASFFNRNR